MKGLRCRKERDHNWQMNSPGTGRQCWLMNDITKRFICLSRARNCPCRRYERSLGWTTLMLQEAHSAIHMLKEGMQIANIRKSLSTHLLPFFYTTETHFQAVYSSCFEVHCVAEVGIGSPSSFRTVAVMLAISFC